MFSQHSQLIVGCQGGCVGCPCNLRWSGLRPRRAPDGPDPEAGSVSGRQDADRGLVRAALLLFGAPLLLLLCSAAGACAFAEDQSLWALAGVAPLLCVTVGRAVGRVFKLGLGGAGR